jgi:hypothetical protein
MSLHPEAYPLRRQVADPLKQLADRIRILEGRQSPIPLAVAPATPASTTSTVAVPLWLMTGVFPAGWQVTVTARVGFDTDGVRGELELRDATNHTLAAESGTAGQLLTFTAADPAMPLALYGHVPAGTLFVTVVAAQAGPWAG